jgi:hypothetical protein
MADVFPGVSAEDGSPVSEHRRLTGGQRLLERDPSEFMADMVIKVAEARGVQVVGRLIVEAQLEGLLRPGTPFFEAASGFDATATRAIAADLLRWTNRDALIGPDLEPDRSGEDTDGDFRPGDRVRLVLNATSEGQRYVIGTTGLIVRAPTAEGRATLAAAGHYAFRADEGGAIIVVKGYAIEPTGEPSPPPPSAGREAKPAPARPLQANERLSTGEGLSQEERGQVERWAVGFNSARPPDGRLSTAVIESAGPIPVSGAPARAVAREYFESKLPAAEVRRNHALQAADPASVPEDWFNAPAYWRAVIAWLDGQGEGAPLPVPARPQWYFRDDVVELDRDVAIGGRPYREGTTGTVLDVEDDTLAKLSREGRIAVMFPGDDLEVVPVELLRPAGKAGRGPLRSPESCNHAWSQAGYRWGPVDSERRLRPFWSRSVCSSCGAERLHDSDQYYGGDMAIVHLKWRGSTW